MTGGHFNSKVNGERGVGMVTECEKMNVSHEIWMMIMKIIEDLCIRWNKWELFVNILLGFLL